MPRPPKVIRETRKIRTAIGFNQQEMANLLGVSRRTIERVENGTLQLSSALASRYHEVTDCDLDDNGEPVATCQGKPYTNEDFERMQESKVLFSDDPEVAIRRTLIFMEMTLEAAKNEGKLDEAIAKAELAREKLTEALDIKKETGRLVYPKGGKTWLRYKSRVRTMKGLPKSPVDK